ncbi:unnamed protein product [Owenia fusiformis]|uniref:NAD(+) kinase n=1 Tax=Owenia fusiformis TaxID=6347 RepID=A0A8J1UA67_OWEFU|nr:unnamed protein product [Owenia fusiformis]
MWHNRLIRTIGNVQNCQNILQVSVYGHFSRRNLFQNGDQSAFNPKTAAVVTKMTRYEYEKKFFKGTEDELKQYLYSKGSDYNILLMRYRTHQNSLNSIVNALQKKNIETRVLTRFDYTQDLIDSGWPDVVFTAGGDGTYLLAASKVTNQDIPVIGVNSDPARSEGYLCIPKQLSTNFSHALDRLLDGKFRWKRRQRIRVTMSGKHMDDDPVELHDSQLKALELRSVEHVKENEVICQPSKQVEKKPSRILPHLALNEVFIGETNSARVSYYEISIDGSPSVKQKSSGITVCTGTGSSSWHFHINHITKEDIKKILRIANEISDCKLPKDVELLSRKLTRRFNCSLKFPPEEHKMAYTVRDPVINGIFQVTKARGFVNKMEVKSRLWDACLVLDGSSSFSFNDGAIATLEMREEDALRTVDLE